MLDALPSTLSSIGLQHLPQLSTPRIVASVLCVAPLLFAARGIYNLYFSPLRSIPGPWYAAVSEIWILVHTFRCRKVRAIDDLFKAYGPVVRISPNTVAFVDQQTTRIVYNGMKLDKGPIYGAVKMVAIIEHSVHAKYRRIFSSHYTPGNIALIHPDMKASALVLVEKMLEAKDRQPLDIFPGIHLVMIDLILKSTFGNHYGALDDWSETSHNVILSAIEECAGITPRWLMAIVSRFPNKSWRDFCHSGDTLFNTTADMVRETQVAIIEGRLEEREKPTLIQRFMAHNETCAPEDILSFEDMASESMTHLLAGVDASAVLTSYILWQFASLSDDVKQKIYTELDLAMPNATVIPDLKVLQSLPMLDALFKEGLRLHGPIPTFLERLAPRGETLDLMGYKLPPETVIGTQSWSMHRDATVFPEPETFDVLRWLGEDKSLEAQTQSLAPFGLGTRVCIGQHLARNAIKTMLAAIIRNFEILSSTGTNERTMEMMELFGMFPVGLSCKLEFRPRA
ncbi:cytochrome P450 [Mycena pura]|uniref:Cytochrome P450 n=1 Tax=Mycena pura TaxID=153505 RepID=A0AAD6VPT0_9AGAR|nr:cytochrome P450 [Mycena pura]